MLLFNSYGKLLCEVLQEREGIGGREVTRGCYSIV